MKPRIWLCAFLFVSSKGALGQDCVQLDCGKNVDCNVTSSMLAASLPAGLEIKSLGSGTRISFVYDAAIADCRASRAFPKGASADQATFRGTVQVKGTLRASGIVRFEPNDGGNLEFRPAISTFVGTGNFFRSNFRQIKLDEAQPSVVVTPPRSLAKVNCWQATAKAQLTDFSIVIADTSSAGSYARVARISKVSGFSKCEWGGK